MRFFLTEPADRAGDALAGLRFEAGSSDGVGKEAFRALHRLGSGTFKKGQTGQAETFNLKPDEARMRHLRHRIQTGETILIVAVPGDDEVAAIYVGAGAEPEGNWPCLTLDGRPAK